MSSFDHLNNDLLALIAQHLPVKELLYFIRSHRRLHSLNSSNISSWSSRAFQYSHVAIELYEEWKFHEWLMKSHKYVHSAEAAISPSDNSATTIESGNFNLFRFLLNSFRSCRRHWEARLKLTEREIARQLYLKRVNKGLISLSTWHSIKHGFCYVLNRWFDEHADEMKDWECTQQPGYRRDKLDMELAKNIIETRDNPPTTVITLDSGEKCEVLAELNENILKNKISARFAPCYRSRLILSATPNLRALSLCIDAAQVATPKFDDLIGLVPHLRSLTLYQGDSDQSNTECSLIPIRQTMKYLSELESLTIDHFVFNIQDLIDISSHPRLKYIKLDDDSEGIDEEEWEWFSSSYKFNSEQSPNQEHNDRINVDYQLADDKYNELIEKAATNEFHVDGDEGDEDLIDEDNHWYYDAWKPGRILADIEYIHSSLSLPSSSAASIKARLKLLNLLRIPLFRPHRSGYARPLKYLRHLRHQIYLLHSSLTQSLATIDE